MQILSGTGEDITAVYPWLWSFGFAPRPRPAVLDGVITPPDEEGQRARLVLIDLMMLGGQLLVDRPHTERRRALLALGMNGPLWVSPPAVAVGHSAEALQAARAGIVCKRLTSRYEPGVSTSWIKIDTPITGGG